MKDTTLDRSRITCRTSQVCGHLEVTNILILLQRLMDNTQNRDADHACIAIHSFGVRPYLPFVVSISTLVFLLNRQVPTVGTGAHVSSLPPLFSPFFTLLTK
jgi:hypothetical protein